MLERMLSDVCRLHQPCGGIQFGGGPSSADWTGVDWAGVDWAGVDWTASLKRYCVDWSGLDWIGLDEAKWIGLEGIGLEWTK